MQVMERKAVCVVSKEPMHKVVSYVSTIGQLGNLQKQIYQQL
jgi:hypothetical protein